MQLPKLDTTGIKDVAAFYDERADAMLAHARNCQAGIARRALTEYAMAYKEEAAQIRIVQRKLLDCATRWRNLLAQAALAHIPPANYSAFGLRHFDRIARQWQEWIRSSAENEYDIHFKIHSAALAGSLYYTWDNVCKRYMLTI